VGEAERMADLVDRDRLQIDGPGRRAGHPGLGVVEMNHTDRRVKRMRQDIPRPVEGRWVEVGSEEPADLDVRRRRRGHLGDRVDARSLLVYPIVIMFPSPRPRSEERMPCLRDRCPHHASKRAHVLLQECCETVVVMWRRPQGRDNATSTARDRVAAHWSTTC